MSIFTSYHCRYTDSGRPQEVSTISASVLTILITYSAALYTVVGKIQTESDITEKLINNASNGEDPTHKSLQSMRKQGWKKVVKSVQFVQPSFIKNKKQGGIHRSG